MKHLLLLFISFLIFSCQEDSPLTEPTTKKPATEIPDTDPQGDVPIGPLVVEDSVSGKDLGWETDSLFRRYVVQEIQDGKWVALDTVLNKYEDLQEFTLYRPNGFYQYRVGGLAEGESDTSWSGAVTITFDNPVVTFHPVENTGRLYTFNWSRRGETWEVLILNEEDSLVTSLSKSRSKAKDPAEFLLNNGSYRVVVKSGMRLMEPQEGGYSTLKRIDWHFSDTLELTVDHPNSSPDFFIEAFTSYASSGKVIDISIPDYFDEHYKRFNNHRFSVSTDGKEWVHHDTSGEKYYFPYKVNGIHYVTVSTVDTSGNLYQSDTLQIRTSFYKPYLTNTPGNDRFITSITVGDAEDGAGISLYRSMDRENWALVGSEAKKYEDTVDVQGTYYYYAKYEENGTVVLGDTMSIQTEFPLDYYESVFPKIDTLDTEHHITLTSDTCFPVDRSWRMVSILKYNYDTLQVDTMDLMLDEKNRAYGEITVPIVGKEYYLTTFFITESGFRSVGDAYNWPLKL